MRIVRLRETPIAATQPKPLADLSRVLPLAALCLFAIAIIRSAWVSDDAFIALRAVENVLAGHGLVANPPERAQAFTSPLWTLILVLVRSTSLDAYATLVIPALIASLFAATWLAFRLAATPVVGAFAVLLLTLSGAFTQFSTSGLENPLSHALLGIFVAALFKPNAARSWVVWLIASLVALCRFDLILLVAPALALLGYQGAREAVSASGVSGIKRQIVAAVPIVRRAALGSLPLLAWLAFSIVYYGFPWPNTAYAKLNLHVPRLEILGQGFSYLFDMFARDPLTILVLLAGLAVALLSRERRTTALAIGIVLYLGYVVTIGGDFMAGRFFTAPLFTMVALAAVRLRESGAGIAALAAAAGFIGVLFPGAFTPHEKFDCPVPPSGIVDERRCYAEHTGLSVNLRRSGYRTHEYYKIGREYRDKGKRVVVSGYIGLAGVAAGPGVHIVDNYALTDPLLARIPFRPEGDWRIGHFPRPLPRGYAESLVDGKNRIEPPCIRRYYDALHEVLYGQLVSASRWKEIVLLNIGHYDDLLEPSCTKPD